MVVMNKYPPAPCQCCGIWQSVPASACRKTRTAKRRGISPTSRPVTYLTKMQERKRFIAEFARRLREARPGERVYMRVGKLLSSVTMMDPKIRADDG